MKKCPSCGKINDNKAQFCIGCGNRIYINKAFAPKHYIEFALIGLGIISGIYFQNIAFFIPGIIAAIIINFYPKIGGIISFIIAFFSLDTFGNSLMPSFFFFLAAITCYLGDYLYRYF